LVQLAPHTTGSDSRAGSRFRDHICVEPDERGLGEMIDSYLLRPYVVGPTAILAMLAGVAFAIFDPTLPAQGGTEAHAGGSEEPPRKAVAMLEKMPRHPTAVSIDEPVAVGRGAERKYAVRGKPEKIVEFLEAQLHTQGWQAEGPMTVETSDMLRDGTVSSMHKQSFITGEGKVTVSAVESKKDSKRGIVRLSVVVEPF
jgi:hypothetical protein